MVAEIFSSITSWYLEHISYGTVVLLMSIESSFIPFPSEIVVPPAAYKAAQGTLNIFGVFCAATAGALIGAIFNYFFAYFLGRKVLYRLADTRIAHFLLITGNTLEKAESYFLKYDRSSTFIGRFIPAIRQLISLPAGFAKMNFKQFLLFTALGSGLWNLILILLGFFLYTQKELLEEYYTDISVFFLVGGFIFFGYMIYKGIKRDNNISS